MSGKGAEVLDKRLHNSAGLVVDEILDWRAGSTIFAGQDADGHDYLVLEQTSASGTRWVCAPISPLALRCVRAGRADMRDAFCHTTTGYVLIFSGGLTGNVVTSTVLCNSITEDLLPARNNRLASAA